MANVECRVQGAGCRVRGAGCGERVYDVGGRCRHPLLGGTRWGLPHCRGAVMLVSRNHFTRPMWENMREVRRHPVGMR